MKIWKVWIRLEKPEGTLAYRLVEAENAASAASMIKAWLRDLGYVIEYNDWAKGDTAVIERIEKTDQKPEVRPDTPGRPVP